LTTHYLGLCELIEPPLRLPERHDAIEGDGIDGDEKCRQSDAEKQKEKEEQEEEKEEQEEQEEEKEEKEEQEEPIENVNNGDDINGDETTDAYNYHMEVEKTNDAVPDIDDYIYTYKLKRGVSRIRGGVKVLRDMNYPQLIIEQAKECI
jgi:hypothetical protein